MQKLNIAICEDDANMLELISGSITAIFSKRSVELNLTTARSATKLRAHMEQQRFDLIFLDIQMPQESGIQFALWLRKQGDRTAIIYVSSQEGEVFEALQTQPFGFVRKRNFLQDIEPLVDRFLNQYFDEKSGRCAVVLTQKSGIFRIPVDNISHLEGDGKNQQLFYRDKSEPTVLRSTMDALENTLAPYGFIRIHKGFLVNYQAIAAMLPLEVELENGQRLPLSRRRSQEIKLEYLRLTKENDSILL